MTLEILQAEMTRALREGEKQRKNVISGMISDIKKEAINKKCKDNITEELVNTVLLRCKKTYQEMVNTCPEDRKELLASYQEQLAIVSEFTPKLITDEREIYMLIASYASENQIPLVKANKGKIMKLASTNLKGKADMKIVSKIVGGMLA